jgi:hypothetical protein
MIEEGDSGMNEEPDEEYAGLIPFKDMSGNPVKLLTWRGYPAFNQKMMPKFFEECVTRFQHAGSIQRVKKAKKAVKIIHFIRDPRDIVTSCYHIKRDFIPGMDYNGFPRFL